MTDTWYIIGGGSSLNQTGLPFNSENAATILESISEDLEGIKDKNVIGVNAAFRLGEWVDICWFGDKRWYAWNKKHLQKFKGKIYCACPSLQNQEMITKAYGRSVRKQGIEVDSNLVSWNGSSGGCVLNLAYHLGARKVILLGYDMKRSSTCEHNWHDWHRIINQENNPYARFKRSFTALNTDLTRLGVEVINATPDSDLDVFNKKSLSDCIKEEEVECHQQ